MLNHVFAFATSTILTFASATLAFADDVSEPTKEIILTVTGTDAADPVRFDRAGLEALGFETIETTTIWSEGVQTFEGVSLKSILDELGVTEGTLLATAINDYTVEIPVLDAVENGPIIAVMLNGDDMSIREKGPLWVVYPYDSSADYRSEVVYSRSIWQLDRIEVVE